MDRLCAFKSKLNYFEENELLQVNKTKMCHYDILVIFDIFTVAKT